MQLYSVFIKLCQAVSNAFNFHATLPYQTCYCRVSPSFLERSFWYQTFFGLPFATRNVSFMTWPWLIQKTFCSCYFQFKCDFEVRGKTTGKEYQSTIGHVAINANGLDSHGFLLTKECTMAFYIHQSRRPHFSSASLKNLSKISAYLSYIRPILHAKFQRSWFDTVENRSYSKFISYRQQPRIQDRKMREIWDQFHGQNCSILKEFSDFECTISKS